MNAIFSRASVRAYQDRPVEAEKIEKLLRAAMAAPSARNQQPWEFIVVQDAQQREKLGAVSQYSSFAAKAPLDIVVLCRPDLPSEPHWQQDLGACTQNILLEAVELGLGGCWIGIAPREERMAVVKEALAIPDGYLPYCILAIGYPEHPVTGKDRFEESRIHYDRF